LSLISKWGNGKKLSASTEGLYFFSSPFSLTFTPLNTASQLFYNVYLFLAKSHHIIYFTLFNGAGLSPLAPGRAGPQGEEILNYFFSPSPKSFPPVGGEEESGSGLNIKDLLTSQPKYKIATLPPVTRNDIF